MIEKIITKEDVAERFFWYVRSNFRNLDEAAKKYGVSKQYISFVTRGKRNLSEAMMDDIGVVRVDGWVDKEEE